MLPSINRLIPQKIIKKLPNLLGLAAIKKDLTNIIPVPFHEAHEGQQYLQQLLVHWSEFQSY